MSPRIIEALLTTVLVVAIAACGDDDTPHATPSPGVPTATPTATLPVPTATPTVPSDGYPLTQRTGIAGVDVVLEALESKEEARIQALFVETPSPCVVNPVGIHNPPACPEGVPGGTLLPVFRAMAGEAVWPVDLANPLQYWLSRDYRIVAVYSDAPAAFNGWLPAAQYAIVLGAPEGRTTVRVEGSRINGWWFGEPGPGRHLEGVSPWQYILQPPR